MVHHRVSRNVSLREFVMTQGRGKAALGRRSKHRDALCDLYCKHTPIDDQLSTKWLPHLHAYVDANSHTEYPVICGQSHVVKQFKSLRDAYAFMNDMRSLEPWYLWRIQCVRVYH